MVIKKNSLYFLIFLLAVLAKPLSGQVHRPAGQQPVAVISLKFIRTAGTPEMEIEDFVVVKTSKTFDQHRSESVHAAFALIPVDTLMYARDTIFIEDPFNPVYEYSEDEVTLRRATLAQDENHILVRFPWSEAITQIHLARISENRMLEVVSSAFLPNANN